MSTKSLYSAPLRLICACLVLPAVGQKAVSAAFDFGKASDAYGFRETFDIDEGQQESLYDLTLIETNAPGNVFHPGEETVFTFQLGNLTEQALKIEGKVEVIRYGGRARPGEQWVPEFYKIDNSGSVPIHVALESKGWQNITVRPKTPETKGGYALIVDLGRHDRQLLTTYVRTLKPSDRRVQYPKQSLENMPPEILRRLGIQAIRYGVHYEPSGSRRCEEYTSWLADEFKAMHANRVTAVVEIGASPAEQPLGHGRALGQRAGVRIRKMTPGPPAGCCRPNRNRRGALACSICYSSSPNPASSPRHFCRSVSAILGEVSGQIAAFSPASHAVSRSFRRRNE